MGCDASSGCKSIDFKPSTGECNLGDCQIGDGVCVNDNDADWQHSSCQTSAPTPAPTTAPAASCTESGAPCVFPFTIEGTTYNSCTTDHTGYLWCATDGAFTWSKCISCSQAMHANLPNH